MARGVPRGRPGKSVIAAACETQSGRSSCACSDDRSQLQRWPV